MPVFTPKCKLFFESLRIPVAGRGCFRRACRGSPGKQRWFTLSTDGLRPGAGWGLRGAVRSQREKPKRPSPRARQRPAGHAGGGLQPPWQRPLGEPRVLFESGIGEAKRRGSWRGNGLKPSVTAVVKHSRPSSLVLKDQARGLGGIVEEMERVEQGAVEREQIAERPREPAPRSNTARPARSMPASGSKGE